MAERIRTISISPVGLDELLGLPTQAKGIVLFAHGSGSGRFSPRNNFVAQALREAGLATLLFDLLTDDEARDRRNVFDIVLLARRLLMAANWARDDAETTNLPVGYFGASTGAAAALVAAATDEGPVAAIVSRGGRPDLAGPALSSVKAPTLLIVGGDDVAVLAFNRAALAELRKTARRRAWRHAPFRRAGDARSGGRARAQLVLGAFRGGRMMKYADRGQAGHRQDRQPVVLALPRGGVAVGFEIARALDAALDIVLVRKIGVPWQPELALGAPCCSILHLPFISHSAAETN